MRLIDADALFHGQKLIVVKEEAYDAVRYIFDQIDNAPTIEAEPVRHGRWDEVGILTFCSECGWTKHIMEEREYEYCPNCGAKMDEVK